MNLIDLDAIPEAPPGSDADKIAKGEPPAKPDVMQKVYILGDVKR